MMAYPHYRPHFGDTTFTKLFVGGLAWETPTEELRKYFEQFGDILEAVIITDKNTGKSKGYGFVTFRDQESARRACADPNPVIDGRRANCNIASLGRTRPSPPRGRNYMVQAGGGGEGGQQGGGMAGAGPSYGGVPGAGPSSLGGAGAVMYPPYGYPTYTPDYGYHHQHCTAHRFISKHNTIIIINNNNYMDQHRHQWAHHIIMDTQCKQHQEAHYFLHHHSMQIAYQHLLLLLQLDPPMYTTLPHQWNPPPSLLIIIIIHSNNQQ
ncbi:hypothetical protein PIB30_118027 [Stylosanthes scabra]|uniref:RRM domain-containing protein n=1 Tax=Stylosanthes scabra TaxID=79078 RepID=A0ABU6T6U4_9FABA|nr:hypothetical protein [Stylosanthes scabra]